jgi:hypothetical protein
MPPAINVLAMFVLVIGCIGMSIPGIAMLARFTQVKTSFTATIATVTGASSHTETYYDSDGDRHERTVYELDLQYVDKDGNMAYAHVATQQAHKERDEVPIRYDPENKQDVELEPNAATWITTIAFLSFGIIFLFIVFRVMRR